MERWRYDPPKGVHVLRVGYRPADGCFYGVQWEYEHGSSRVLFRLDGGCDQVDEICALDSWAEEFCIDIDNDALITSSGEFISVYDGSIINRLAFRQIEYPDAAISR